MPATTLVCVYTVIQRGIVDGLVFSMNTRERNNKPKSNWVFHIARCEADSWNCDANALVCKYIHRPGDVRTWSPALLALICSCCYPEQAVWHHSNAFDDALPDTLRLWHSAPHSLSSFTLFWMGSWLILGLRPSNKRRRYFETASLIGWAQT